MYTTLDITLILKDIELFSNLTNDDIFNIAKIANIENFIKNEIIFEKGEEGDAMYIVIDGSVSIFNGNNEIAILGAGECFGELALLDGEPRSTSIKSIDDTIVIKISKEEFYSLISDKIEIVKGIIKILSSRLRNTIS